MAKKKKSKNKKKEKVCEIFKVKKGEKEEIKKVCGEEEIKISSKEQIKKENKQLKQIFIGIGIVVLIFILIMLFIRFTAHFTYGGVKFKIVKEGELIFYNTFFKMYNEEGAHIADYNFYIRNDPRKLEEIPFKGGELVLTKNMVINMTYNFNCEGDGIIALANFVKLHEFLGMEVIQDPNAGCDFLGQYTFVKIASGDETKIEKYGPSCYKMYIHDCEILQGTERFMLETFIKANKALGN